MNVLEAHMTGTNLVKGMIGGLVGTVILSALMIMKGMMGIMAHFDMIGMMANMLDGSRPTAWLAHFIIGTVLWGGLFVWVDPYLPSQSHWIKGIVFGAGAWLMMMITVMPMAGAGLFAINLGMMITAATLMLHAIFGAVMGAVYGAEHPERSFSYQHVRH
jgi:hypothetical protein